MRAPIRAAALGAALLVAAPAPGQQPTQIAAPADTVPQARFTPNPETRSIEVTPLAPPGTPAGPEDSGRQTETITVPQESWGGQREGAAEDRDAVGPVWRRPGKGRLGTTERPLPNMPLGPAVPVELPPTELRAGARLRQLDKMTGMTDTFEIAAGEARQVGRMRIRLEACRSPEENGIHGTIAFVKAWDRKNSDDEVFSGWMFAESPALSAMDHPRYDLWVISCTTSSLAVSEPSE